MHEWSLLFFTVCLQGAIGLMFFITLFQKSLKTLSDKDLFTCLKWPLFVATGLSLVGLIASFTHLGSPTRAMNTLFGFGRSWMSNEIVVTSAFIGLVVLCTALALLKKKVYMSIVSVTAIVGLIDVYCMAKIYTNSLVDGWNNLNTFTSFYGTAFVLGAILFIVLVLSPLKEFNTNLSSRLLKWSFSFAIGGIGIQLIGLSLFFIQDINLLIINSVPWSEKMTPYLSTILIRWFVELVGIGILGYVVLSSKNVKKLNFLYLALLLLIGSEFINRYLFYVLGA